MLDFHCKHCFNTHIIEQSLSNDNINELYNELIKELFKYRNEYVNIFIDLIKIYKNKYIYYKNKDILIFMSDLTCDMLTYNERENIIKNNNIISKALIMQNTLLKNAPCGYGSSCNSSCVS
jgi:hypothetical protein|tara:strand:- start:200 stop:562 length:363 start_codon:yes stop_codon:yes gene_type:complete